MAALIQFVDSISATPTVRLDLNDGVSWFTTNFKAPPPRLRRSESENSMRDGGVVGSSSYGNRTLELDLTLIEESSEEWAADEMQKLWRELDRPSNFIRYWPEGLDKPVFFRTFRSDVSELEELWTTPIARNISLEILAEHFALGLKETLGPFTVNNDPAAASNPCSVQVTGVLGDVLAPATLTDSTATRTKGIVGNSTQLALAALEAESAAAFTLGTDTTNPGGGPDASMSGTGTNNFRRTSFATNAAMVDRLTTTSSSITTSGLRVFAVVRRSDNTSAMAARLVVGGAAQAMVLIPATTARQVVDLGRIPAPTDATAITYKIQAQRTSGAGTLDWDVVFHVPATDTIATWDSGVADALGDLFFLSSDTDSVSRKHSTGAYIKALVPFAGSLPRLAPNVTNYVTWIVSGLTGHDKTTTSSLTFSYYPRYLFVRTVSS